ncbi:MAG: hypothetical protein ACKVIX_07930, partial [Sphingomonadales bacterium]
ADGANDAKPEGVSETEIVKSLFVQEEQEKDISLDLGALSSEDRATPQEEGDDLAIPSFLKNRIAK